MSRRHGEAQVHAWRRSYDVPPPAMDKESEYFKSFIDDPKYAEIRNDLPVGESLKMTVARVVPYFYSQIAPLVKSGKRVLISGHENSLRSLLMVLDGIPEDTIPDLNIPTGIPLLYHLDENLKPIRQPEAISPLSGVYLGNLEEISTKITEVKNQACTTEVKN